MGPVPLASHRGDIVLAAGMRIRSSAVIEVARAAELHCVYVDLEHGQFTAEEVEDLSRTASTCQLDFLVRLPNASPEGLPPPGNADVRGIIVPGVSTAAELSRLAAGMPSGIRMVPMIETCDAVENADAIAALSFVDVLLVGTNDLCASLGVRGELDHALVRAAYARVLWACARRGKSAGVGGLSAHPELLRKYVRAGARFVTLGTDLLLIERAFRANRAAVMQAARAADY